MQVVVVTNTSLAEAIRIDEACRKQSIPFIRADTRGVFSCVFCDFGQSFTVYDPDGEAPSPPVFKPPGRVLCASLDVSASFVGACSRPSDHFLLNTSSIFGPTGYSTALNSDSSTAGLFD